MVFPVLQLWCGACVNMSGGRTAAASELSKQVKGSQSSLDHLDSDGKVRRWRLEGAVALFPVVGFQDNLFY